jgi:hypothetical protein
MIHPRNLNKREAWYFALWDRGAPGTLKKKNPNSNISQSVFKILLQIWGRIFQLRQSPWFHSWIMFSITGLVSVLLAKHRWKIPIILWPCPSCPWGYCQLVYLASFSNNLRCAHHTPAFPEVHGCGIISINALLFAPAYTQQCHWHWMFLLWLCEGMFSWYLKTQAIYLAVWILILIFQHINI